MYLDYKGSLYGTVIRVVDGDTYEVEFQLMFGIKKIETCRLVAVDTWENRGQNKLLGIKATEDVRLEIEGKSYWFKLYGRGSFSRVLIDFDITQGQNIAKWLENRGHIKKV